MNAFFEILIEALKKYAAEIIAAILVSLSFWFLPPLRRLITGRKASEIRKQLKEAREIERKKAEEFQKKLDEAQKQVEKTQQELNEAKKQVEKVKQESTIKNEMYQRELDEARKHAEAVQNEAIKKNEEAKRQVELVRQETLKQNEETKRLLAIAQKKATDIELAWEAEKTERKEYKRILICSVLLLLVCFYLVIRDVTENRAMEGYTTAQAEMGDRAYQVRDYYRAYVWYYVAYLGGYSNSDRLKDLEGGWFSSGKLSSYQVKNARAEAQKKFDEIQNRIKK